jgi:hypothetical protein
LRSSETLGAFIVSLFFIEDIRIFLSVIDYVRMYFWFNSLMGWVRIIDATTGLSTRCLPYTS